MKKIITLFLTFAMLLSFLNACANDPDNGPVSGTEGGTETEAPPAQETVDIPLVTNGAATFTVAYVRGESKIAGTAMQYLIDSFSSEFGVELTGANIWDSEGTKTCIVFGNTGDEEMNAIHKGLRNRDYSITIKGNLIRIVALTEETYIMAVNSLMAKLREQVGETVPVQSLSIGSDYSMNLEGRYSIMSAKIEGVELKEFYLLKPTNENITEELVTKLKDNIALSYGFNLSQKVREADGQHYVRLVIDNQLDPLHYECAVENGDLILRAGGAYSIKFAVVDIITLMRADKKQSELVLENGYRSSANLLDNPDGLTKAENSNLRLMSCNVMATFEGWDGDAPAQGVSFDMRAEIFNSYLTVYDPDVLGLQEVCNVWMDELNSLDKSKWGVVTGGGTRIYFLNPILYRTDRYKLVTEGWINYSVTGNSQGWGGRYMTWAVFESLATGEKFGLVNVHWAGWSHPEANEVQARETLAKMKELHEAYNCPIASTGDYNTRDFVPSLKGDATVPNLDICDPAYADMIKDGSVKDAKFYNEKLVNDIGSVHAWGSAAYPRPYSFDHIFCTSDTTVRQFYSAWDNQQRYASDHAWLIADIDLSVKKTQ